MKLSQVKPDQIFRSVNVPSCAYVTAGPVSGLSAKIIPVRLVMVRNFENGVWEMPSKTCCVNNYGTVDDEVELIKF